MDKYTKAIIDVHNQQPETIESLRHDLAQAQERVKELEVALADCDQLETEWMHRVQETEKELAALKGITAFAPNNAASNVQSGAFKAGQGEPVCYLREEWLSYEQSAEGQPGAFPVYASAPTIPEVLFDGMTVYNKLTDQQKIRTSPENVADTLDTVVQLLRAAPKPEE